MKFIVDEINPEKCPFLIDEEWDDEELYDIRKFRLES